MSDSKDREQKKYLSRFLDFDIHGYSNSEECKKYRYQVMINYLNKKENSSEDHLLECPNCKTWKADFDNGTLQAEYSTEMFPYKSDDEIVNLTPCTSEECRQFRLAYHHRTSNEGIRVQHQKHVCDEECCAEWFVKYREEIENKAKMPDGLNFWHDTE